MIRKSVSRVALRKTSVFAAILCVLALGACDASRPAEVVAPEPGQLTLRFQTSNNAEGAVRVRLDGPAIGAIAAVQDGTLAFSRVDGLRREIVVVGELKSGTIVRFDVPDVNRVEKYVAAIVEVAGIDNSLRDDLDGYSVEVLR